MKKINLLLCSLLVSLFFVTACDHSNKKPEDPKPAPNPGPNIDDPLKPEKVTIEEANTIIEAHKGNKDFVILDVRTDAEFKEGYLQGHLYTEDTDDNDPAGVLQHDFYDPNFDQWILTLDKAKRYLIHCRTDKRSEKAFNKMKAAGFKKIQYIEGGYTAWAKKYPNKLRKPEFDLAVDIQIKGDKIKTTGEIKFDFLVTNLQGDPLRKAKLNAKIVLDATDVETKEVEMGNDGKNTYTFNAAGKTKGAYRLICTVAHKSTEGVDYKPAEAHYYFDVAEQDVAVSGSEDDIATDDVVSSEVRKKFYNRNIYGYKAYNSKEEVVTLGKSIDKTKPTLLILFSPLCGGCMVKAQELDKYKLDSINLIPTITSVNEDNLKEGIAQTEKQLKDDFNLGSMVPSALYDAKDKIWFSRFKFNVTPIFILINKEGQIKDIVYGSNEMKVETLLNKMETKFGLPKFVKK